MPNVQDLKVSGFGKFNGGQYRDIAISGMGDIDGDVAAESLHISGMGKISGNAVIDKVSVQGTGTFLGDLESRIIKNSGMISVEGRIKTEELSVNGTLTTKKGLKAVKISLKGFLTCGEGVEAEEFYSKGGFKIGGLLNSNDIDIKFGWECYAKEIGGEEIRIRHGHFSPISFLLNLFGKKDRMETDLIEGNNISIEYTDAKVVRGNKVYIGENCEIGQVEYKESIEIAPGAIVKSQVKV